MKVVVVVKEVEGVWQEVGREGGMGIPSHPHLTPPHPPLFVCVVNPGAAAGPRV